MYVYRYTYIFKTLVTGHHRTLSNMHTLLKASLHVRIDMQCWVQFMVTISSTILL